MHVLGRQDVVPLETEHGEVIYELIGRGMGTPTERHSVAYVTIPPGKSSPLHFHPIAEESYFILQAKARMIIDHEQAVLSPGQAVLIPPNHTRQIINIGETDLEFLAFCVPAWEPTNTVFLDEADDG